ncbi:hypothetical protein ENROMM299B_14930 [Enterobacter roggenkampii]
MKKKKFVKRGQRSEQSKKMSIISFGKPESVRLITRLAKCCIRLTPERSKRPY